MQIETLAEELEAAGIEPDQGRVYVRLLQTGPAKVAKLKQFFDCSRSTLYRLLDELADEGYVTKSLDHPTVYEAVDPDELFEISEARLRRSKERLERVRERCEPDLRSIARATAEAENEHHWRKIEGTAKIYRTYHEMAEDAETSIWVASNHETSFAGYMPVVEEAWQVSHRRAKQDEIDVRLLFDLGDDPGRNVPSMVEGGPTYHLRSLDVDQTVHFALVDEKGLLVWVRPAPLGPVGKKDDVAVETNAPGIVFAHRMLFERLWSESDPVDPNTADGG